MDFLPFTRPSIDEETIAAVADVLRSGWITTGPKCQQFEAELSALCGGRPVKVFNSGTLTLEIALELAGIGHGDEVITSPLTWAATANVVVKRGARPVFADIDTATRMLDLAKVEAAITPRTKAIIPVDLAGLPLDRDALYALATRHKLRVIEDAAQSLGANWNGTPIGQAFGDGSGFVSFSFHANKNLTTCEGGALVLPPDVEPAKVDRLRLQGVQRFPDGTLDVDMTGHKGNLTDVAAAVGLGQLKRLDEFTARRRVLAQRYFVALRAAGLAQLLGLPLEDFTQSNWHMFQVLVPAGHDRAALMAGLKEKGIGSGVHYPALHLTTLYRRLGWQEGDCPVAEDVGRRILTLPLFPAMADSDVDRVVAALATLLLR